jgi:hypothetical protein
MTIKSGWHFDPKWGFTGSAGSKSVKGYMRGGHVKSERREPKMAKGGHWIAGATKNKGALHRSLGVPEGKKIPEKKLEKAEHSKNPTMRKRAALAETLKGMHHKKGGMMKKAIGGLVTKGEYSDERAETVKPGGAQQFARGGHVVSFYARGGHVKVPTGHVIKGGRNNVGLPKKAPNPAPVSDIKSNQVKPGGAQRYAKGGMAKGMATLGKDDFDATEAKGKFADFKRGGKAKMHKRGGGRC